MTHETSNYITKTALVTALKNIMSKKQLNRITISEICTECGVNRKTFYYYFNDIYELIEWMLKQEAIETINEFDLLNDYESAILFTIGYIRNNRHILSCAFDSAGKSVVQDFIYGSFIETARKTIKECSRINSIPVSPDFEEFMCRFLAHSTAGMINEHLANIENADTDLIVRNFGIMIKSLPDILRKNYEENAV